MGRKTRASQLTVNTYYGTSKYGSLGSFMPADPAAKYSSMNERAKAKPAENLHSQSIDS